MKTALQELMQWFNERPQYDKTSEGYEIMLKAQKLLEKESEQIIDAFNYGYYCASDGSSEEFDLKGRRYYEKTFYPSFQKTEKEIEAWHIIENLKEKYQNK